MSVKERARLLNLQPHEQRPALPKRPISAPHVEERIPALPGRSPVLRPSLNQFGVKSEELLQATKSGVVDLAGKGRVGFLEATDSIKGFISRPRRSNGEATSSDPQEATVMGFSFREHANESFTENEQLVEVGSSASSTKTGSKWKIPEFDRLAVGCTLGSSQGGKLTEYRLKDSCLSTLKPSKRNHSLPWMV